MRAIAWTVSGATLLVAALGLRAAGPDAPIEPKSGVARDNFDASVRPQDDLFRHVNGAWLKRAEIPAERARFGAFDELSDKAEADIRALIEATAASEAPEGSEARKIGDLFASFMDEERVEKLGLEPIQDELAKVAALEDKAALVPLLGEMERVGTPGLFGLFVNTDDKKSDEYILNLYQGGLGLPDESYYREAKFEPIRKAYVAHIAKMFALAGLPEPEDAAGAIMALETRLAKNHWDRVKSRDDTLTYNKKNREELAGLTPGFDWSAYFEALGARDVGPVIVRQPEYFDAMATAVGEVPLETWKSWLAWKILSDRASFLSEPFVEEKFQFYGKTLTGAEVNRPRWKRGVAVVQGRWARRWASSTSRSTSRPRRRRGCRNSSAT